MVICMKEKYPVYKTNRTEPEAEKVYNSLSQANKDAIVKFLSIISINSKGVKRLDNCRRALIRMFDFLEKDYNQITYDDYISIAKALSDSNLGAYCKNDERDFIKRFLKENYDDWRIKFKDLKLLKGKKIDDKDKLKPSDLLTTEEVKAMIKATPDMRKQALIALADVSGCRPEEIMNLKYSDVDFRKKTISVYSHKTGRRRVIPIDSVISYIERLQKDTDSKPNDLLFPSKNGGVLTNNGFNFILQQLGNKAGIKKKIDGYKFRHTRLTFLIQTLSPKTYEEVAGHTLQQGLKTYAHLSDDKIIKEVRERVFEVSELDEGERETLLKEIDKVKNENKDELKELKAQIQNVAIDYEKSQKVITYLLNRMEELSPGSAIKLIETDPKTSKNKQGGKTTFTLYKKGEKIEGPPQKSL